MLQTRPTMMSKHLLGALFTVASLSFSDPVVTKRDEDHLQVGF